MSMFTDGVEQEVIINGLPRLVKMPEDQYVSVDEAIPADIFPIIEEVFEGCSPEFLGNLWRQLWVRGIRKLSDFNKPQAMNLLTQAIKLAVKQDGLSVLRKVKEQSNGSTE